MTKTYRSHTDETWAKARDDFLAGLPAEAVCRRYDLGLSAFWARAKKWRRCDRSGSPAESGADLSLYADIDIPTLIDMSALRLAEAVAEGRSVEAARWIRVRDSLAGSYERLLDRLEVGIGPEVDAMFEAVRAKAPAAEPPAPPPPAPPAAPKANKQNSENSASPISGPSNRAHRRRLAREARRR